MTAKEVQSILEKAKTHTRYELADGTYVPGVTTITGQLNKPGLVPWANKLGLEGIDVGKFVDELGTIGTLAHYLIECQLGNKTLELGDFTPNQLEMAKKCVKKFNEWLKDNKFKVLKTEQQLVSEEHSFGGTCDLYCELNGKKTLIDIKTSKAIYDEMFTQVSAYKALLEENGHAVEDVRIIRIGRNEMEGFEDKRVEKLDLHWAKFRYLLKIYQIDKKIKNGGK